MGHDGKLGSMKSIRSIVQINIRDQQGGAERVTWNLLRAYQERGRVSWLRRGEALSPLRQCGSKRVGVRQARLCLLHGNKE